MNDMSNQPSGETEVKGPSAKELVDRSIARMFAGGVDQTAVARNMARRGPSGKQVRVAHPTWAEQRAAEAVTKPQQTAAPLEPKPFNVDTAYKAEMTKNRCRLRVVYLREEVYLPKSMADQAAKQIASNDEIRVKLIENDGAKPRLKVVELVIGDFRLTLDEAKSASKAVKSDTPKVQQKSDLTGNVKWFNSTKGYGFIVPAGGGKDVFFHVSAVEKANMQDKVSDGAPIQFCIEKGRDGRESAVNLSVPA